MIFFGLCGAFVAIFFVAFIILLATPSIPFLAVCFVLAILNIDSSKVPCEMTVNHTLLKRCLSFQKCWPPIGPKCGLLMISLVNQISWLLLGRPCFQGNLISDCRHSQHLSMSINIAVKQNLSLGPISSGDNYFVAGDAIFHIMFIVSRCQPFIIFYLGVKHTKVN